MEEKKYKLSNLLFDLFMVWLTNGLWLIVLAVMFFRTHK